MAIQKQIKKYDSTFNFTIVNNIPIVELTPLALGVLIKILRLHAADDIQKITKNYIVGLTDLHPSTITKVLKEFREKGHALIRTNRNKKGQNISTYLFSEYPNEDWIKENARYSKVKAKATKKMIKTQRQRGNYKFYNYRHLPPVKPATDDNGATTGEQRQNASEIQLLKDFRKAMKHSQRKFLNTNQKYETVKNYNFITKSMIIYDYFLNHYHQKKMPWTVNHGIAFINLLLDFQDNINVQEENQLLIQFSFFLSCVLEKPHREKGKPAQFFPGLLLRMFFENFDNYINKRKNYMLQGRLHTPPFLAELFENDEIFKNQTIEITTS